MSNWVKLFNEPKSFKVMTKTLPTKGNLVYEYNPLRNYRLSLNTYEYEGNLYSLGELYNRFNVYPTLGTVTLHIVQTLNNGIYNYKIVNLLPEEVYEYKQNNTVLTNEEFVKCIIDAINNNRYAELQNILTILKSGKFKWNTTTSDPILHESGELVDFITDELKINLDHPVQMIPQYSYDGSVNLIINDGITIPKLINTRFSATGKNTYEIIDRKGNNDSNIYDQGTNFESDVSLYKRIQKIPKIDFKGTFPGGSMSIGNYHFYFKLADSDGNESDFIGESGLVSVFIGLGLYSAVHTGQRNQNSFKQVQFTLSDIDSSYDYVVVYYSRSTSESDYNPITEYCKIDKKFIINNSMLCDIVITGDEHVTNISIAEINPLYNIVDAAKTSTVHLNMLFLGNVHKYDIPYNELSDLSLRFLPYLKQEDYDVQLDENYNIQGTTSGYIDSKFIYEKTGYWEEELYRLGIVYILPNNQLSPVFNIRGAIDITTYEDNCYTNYPLYDEQHNRKYITYDETTNYLTNETTNFLPKFKFENNKGVIRLKSEYVNTAYNDIINSLDIRVDYDTIQELKKYVKGYFFVRQPRIPLLLAQGITLGIDETSRTLTLPVDGKQIQSMNDDLTQTYMEVENLDDVKYVSEGFLTRYAFKFEKDSSLPLLAKIALVSLAVVAVTVGTVFTCGAVGAIAGAVASGTIGASLAGTAVTAGVAAVTTSAIGTAAIGIATSAAIGVTGVAAWVSIIDKHVDWNSAVLKLDGINTKVPDGYKLVEKKESRQLLGNDSHFNYFNRLIVEDKDLNKIQAIICPEYSVNPMYYNLIFTGSKHLIKSAKWQNKVVKNGSNYLNFDYRHFYINLYGLADDIHQGDFKIIGVYENSKSIGLSNLMFKARAGEAEEAWRFEKVGRLYPDASEEFNIEQNNSDIIRGTFSSYLAFDDTLNLFQPAEIVNIYIPDYQESKLESYINIRMNDLTQYSAISNRITIDDMKDYLIEKNDNIVGHINTGGYSFNIYRGDCYLCQFTQRINRNFNDPSAPYNETIIDADSWKDNYKPNNTEKYSNINLGDVNAVELGMWITFKLRSSYNLNIRTLDGSNVNESAASGHERGFFPYYPLSTDGSYKIPESNIYNQGFTKYLSDRFNVLLPDVPYIKNWFGTRIMYSNVQVNDAFKNGFRIFKGSNYRDYTREYGEITKLISLSSGLLVIFEHGIGLISVNLSNLQSSLKYINTDNILSEDIKIISDSVGSLWLDSILKTSNYVYGVDTVAKKIWRTNGSSILYISDAKVLEFLNNNITLGERELTPKLGIRNVKTVYNAFKHDIMFTFYDNMYGFEEKVWNLCWNELLERFITFYSWVPSFMENINNIPFSFNRDVSKWIAKLGTSHSQSSFANGVTLSNVIIDNKSGKKNIENISYTYIDKYNNTCTKILPIKSDSYYHNNLIGVLSLNNRNLPSNELPYKIEYSLEHDIYGNYKLFDILPITLDIDTLYEDILFDGNKYGYSNFTKYRTLKLPNDAKHAGQTITFYGLFLKSDVTYDLLCSELYYRNKEEHNYADDIKNKLNYEDLFIFENNKPKLLSNNVYNYPIFKDLTGKRLMLPRDKQLNPDTIVKLLNIKANIQIIANNNSNNLSDTYYNLQAGFAQNTSLIDAGIYESSVAVIPKWNMQFLSTDFWKHGQAGIIDIADDIYPTYWYGKQHPFEFECIISGNPGVHKIFTNLELIANKAKPESFHYEIIGEAYDFAKDKKNMYFRQEAIKAIWQYNGTDISYNKNFLKIQPELQIKSTDFPHNYYSRKDTINEIEDYYVNSNTENHDYRHLSGSEIVYYPNRQEYRIWTHSKAIILNDLEQDIPRSIIAANCNYVEDKWKITINPILVCYKNEKNWNYDDENNIKPILPIMNSPIPENILTAGSFDIPEILSNYNESDFDYVSWLDDNSIYNTSFGEAQNRKELDIKDKFIKIRIRYSGEELAIIDFLNTIYKISYE